MGARREAGWGDVVLWLVTGTLGGLTAGVAAALLAKRRRVALASRSLDSMEESVVERLLADPVLRARPIEVGALASGIVELTGAVRDDDEAHHAVEVAQTAAGVRTVLNRLSTEMLETHLADTRRRQAAGDPSLREPHWYGHGVGMGRRRQSERTDPPRPDDSARTVARTFGADRVTEQASEDLDKAPPAVEGHSTVPGGPIDRGTAEHASHRRLGNVPREPIQDLNPESGVHRPVKKGTALRLAEIGLVWKRTYGRVRRARSGERQREETREDRD